MENNYNRGNDLFVDGKFEEAIECFTLCLQSSPDYGKCLAHRAFALEKLRKHTQALQDCSKAIASNYPDESVYACKGVCSFELGEFETSKKSFELATAKSASGSASLAFYQRMIRKCDLEINEVAFSETSMPIPAVPTSAATSSSTPTLISQSNAFPGKNPAKSSSSTAASDPLAHPLSSPALKKVQNATEYQWYQSDKVVTIQVLAPGLTEADIRVIIEEEYVHLAIIRDGFKEEVVVDKDLYSKIDVAKSKYVIKAKSVDIKLQKVDAFNWNNLDTPGKVRNRAPINPVPSVAIAREAEATNAAKAKAYASNRDWEKIGGEISKELDNEKLEGDAELNKLFKDIYSKADPDTKRAMNKSFQTSGGTVLSTNWKEVGVADYEKEKKAPKGVEWKNWEGEKLPNQSDD